MHRKFPGSRGASGFTLLEMLAVIVLLGVIATIVVKQVGGNVTKGKYGAGKAQLGELTMKVENYILDVGVPPKHLSALLKAPANAPGWAGPYAKPSELKDPFGHPFAYQSPGKHGSYDLIFLGADGKPGGTGRNQDIGNWQ
ncbi:type II secretion system major pseudopilin GspG [Celerinatantimonas sp. MCCC 1A17872]|uniref:type II secretion system major pseudopilin GspG n=1 Tax=Celerinatantimonas sp. MCCC 1A17872 TaxID=3177514 RepID=UPI0038C120AD